MKWLRWLFRRKPAPAHPRARDLIEYYLQSATRLYAAFDLALRHEGFREFAPLIARRLRECTTADWLLMQGDRTAATLVDLQRLRSVPAEFRVELWALASLASNGYVREAAVRALDELGDPAGLRYAIHRTGDWVRNVRVAALDVCRRLVPRAPTDLLLQLRAEYDAWFTSRADLEPVRSLRDACDEVLIGARWTELRDVLFAPGSPRRPFVLRMCLRTNRLDVEVLRRLVRDADPATRRAVAGPLAMHARQLDEATVDAVLNARVPIVTARFVAALPPEAVAALAERLRPLCFRRSSMVRHVACAALAGIGWSAADECRRRLANVSSDVETGVIACLGEQGTRDDQALLAPYADHARPRTRAAALQALGRIAAEAWWPLAVERLSCVDPSERRAARDVLRRAQRPLWVEAARTLATNGDEHTRTAALQALTHDAARGSWSVVPDLLAAILAGHSLPKSWGRLLGWWCRNVTRGWLRADEPTRVALRAVWTRWRAMQPAAPDHMRDSFVSVRHWIEQQLA